MKQHTGLNSREQAKTHVFANIELSGNLLRAKRLVRAWPKDTTFSVILSDQNPSATIQFR